MRFNEIPFADLPLYSSDYDADYPPVATATFLRRYMTEFLAFIGRVYTVLPRSAASVG